MTGKPPATLSRSRKRQLTPRTKSRAAENTAGVGERLRISPNPAEQNWPASFGQYGARGLTFLEANRLVSRSPDEPTNVLMLFFAKAFAVWGRKGTPDATPRMLNLSPHEGGRLEYEPDRDALTLSWRDGGDTETWYEARWWPLIDAPNLAAVFDGEGLAEVIQDHVFSDVEFDHAIDRAEKVAPEMHDFRAWLRTAALYNDYLLFSSGFALRGDPFHFWMDRWGGEFDVSEETPMYVSDFAYILDKKLNGFFDRLSSGEIATDGIPSSGGERRTIEPRHWGRRDTVVDLLTGDLHDARSRQIEWRDVVLRAPKPEAAVAATGEAASSLKAIGTSGRKEDHDYLAALDQLITSGFHESDAKSGNDLSEQMEEAFREAGYAAPKDLGTIPRWFKNHLPALWSKVTNRR